MKALLYAAPHRGNMVWHITLAPAVDFWYRFARQHVPELIMVIPQIPLGHAVFLRNQLQHASFKELSDHGTMLKEIRRFARLCGIGEIAAEASLQTVCKENWLRQDMEWIGSPPDPPPDEDILEQLMSVMSGRSLLPEEVIRLMEYMGHKQAAGRWKTYVQAAYCLSRIRIESAITLEAAGSSSWLGLVRSAPSCRCSRCGERGKVLHWTDCASCKERCPYCESCIMLGRSRLCTPLLIGLPDIHMEDTAPLQWVGLDTMPLAAAAQSPGKYMLNYYRDRWGHRLSDAQLAASMAALEYLTIAESGRMPDRLRKFLLWAVTGAGKTEMLFPLIDHALSSGKRIAVATPRRDVVLELRPRLEKAFPEAKVIALYGGSNAIWATGDITLATTHQLLRYAACFDLVIVDEVDAFPFHNNPMLEYAVAKACKQRGAFVFVSATPPLHLRKQAAAGKIGHAVLPARYHRQPLPVPRRIGCLSLDKLIGRRTASGDLPALPAALNRKICLSVERGASIFLFVPYIRHVEGVVALLKAAFPEVETAGTSSEDELREQKVRDFRDGKVRILVTTTILERGVTIPKADVIIMDANSRLFDEAALIQMAGRAGRSAADPRGSVIFCSPEYTLSQQKAIRHIRGMNRLAQRRGLLDPLPSQ